MLNNPGGKLRALLKGDGVLVAPGAYDGISGVVIEQAGFEVAYLAGAGVSASAIAEPDIGLASVSEVAHVASVVASKLNIPLICDADTGYGNPLNVIRTVHTLEHAGVAAVQIEDQIMPKRCGHLAGKVTVSTEEFSRKLEAAVNEKNNKDTLIIARTDSRATDGFEAAIERSKRYIDTGIDVLFFEAPQTIDEVEKVGKLFGSQIALISNQVYGGRTPSITVKELEQMGYKIVIFPSTLSYGASVMLRTLVDTLKEKGTDKEIIPGGNNAMDLFPTMGLARWQELEQKYK
ncbi:MAG: isocitrate lyase/phosphoenolpyruvate mutase family protein [Clostridiales Family XIII bacterium]|jgi:2-methylisocitrate lyase-like PEP mutase family enzyme|nr:isocitrate lyase/phosphoenolpyruvate mutase family protein [Clostridiales Family XIII bacterium]